MTAFRALLCTLFGHPDSRIYFYWGPGHRYAFEVCTRCGAEIGRCETGEGEG